MSAGRGKGRGGQAGGAEGAEEGDGGLQAEEGRLQAHEARRRLLQMGGTLRFLATLRFALGCSLCYYLLSCVPLRIHFFCLDRSVGGSGGVSGGNWEIPHVGSSPSGYGSRGWVSEGGGGGREPFRLHR